MVKQSQGLNRVALALWNVFTARTDATRRHRPGGSPPASLRGRAFLSEFAQYLTQLSVFQNRHHCELKQITPLGGPLINLLQVLKPELAVAEREVAKVEGG